MNKRKIIILAIFMLSCPCLTTIITAQDNMPSREKRIYDLSLIWKEMQYNFVYSEIFQQTNIDSLYLDYLPKVEQATSLYEYFRVLSSFMAHFNEGHTRIYSTERPDTKPPLDVIGFGEKIIVSNIAKSVAEKIPIGSEILKVDDIPTVEFLKDSIYPYIAATNPHWKFNKSIDEMFYGKPNTLVKITVKTSKGEVNEIEMTRGAKEELVDTTTTLPINIKIIEGDIGYIHLASCLTNNISTINSIFFNWMPQLRNCKSLIIDVRGNRGGSTNAWMMIAASLSESINPQGTFFSRRHVPIYKVWGETYSPYEGYYSGTAMEELERNSATNNFPDSLKLRQPLIVLSDHFSGSATEHFLALMKETGRATIIGEPSVGVLTEPMFVSLSNDLAVMIAIKKYINPDGIDWNATGVLPDIEEKRDFEAYLKGKDNVLERAIEELK